MTPVMGEMRVEKPRRKGMEYGIDTSTFCVKLARRAMYGYSTGFDARREGVCILTGSRQRGHEDGLQDSSDIIFRWWKLKIHPGLLQATCTIQVVLYEHLHLL